MKDSDSNLWQLFVPSEDLLTGRNYYTNLLWALEILVWYDDFAVNAIMLLVDICEKNFEYKISCSPQKTLYEIFCPWYPQTCLSKIQRIELLKKIFDKFPLTASLLLKSLLPTSHSISFLIQHPKWSYKDIKLSSSVTVPEYREVTSEIIKLSLVILPNSTEQWETIIKHINLYESCFDELREKFINYCKSLRDKEVNIVAGYLREQIHNFRKYKDSDWSVSEEYISKVEKLFYEIEPDTIARYRYLFTWRPKLLNPIPYSKGESFDYEKEKQIHFEMRTKAVDDIIIKYGVDDLIDFCGTIERPSDLGAILAEKLLNNAYDFLTLEKNKQSNNSLYASVLWMLGLHNGFDKLIEILQSEGSLSDANKGDILCHTPMSTEEWSKLNCFNQAVIDYYWEHMQAFRFDENYADLMDCYLEKLLAYNRPFSAAQIVAYSNYNNTEIIIHILEKLSQLNKHKEADGKSIADMQDDVMQLFSKLYSNQNIDELTVARLEIAFLPYFKFYCNPKYLIRYLQNNPKEYVGFISKCYSPDEPAKESVGDKSDSEMNMTQIAYDVLHLFKSIPGCNTNSISSDVFNSWINEASEYAGKIGYRRVYEMCLGKILSYSPVGSDGIFPHEIVRDFLERNSNPSLENSFIIEKINQRGVHGITGGMAEKEIANGYYNDSRAIRIACPRTADILKRLGDNYMHQSQYEQQRELLDFIE